MPMGLRVVCLTAALAIAACVPSKLPNVLMVTFDTTRYDHFGCTGDPEARTPTVDALARRGLFFDRVYASVPLTLPSHTTMMTGLEPLSHGVHNNGRFRVPFEVETLAERLQKAGYETAAFVSAYVLHRRFRLDQGFDVYSDETRGDGGRLGFGVPQRPGGEITDEALAWIEERDGNRPFFLWAHYYDPHHPLRAPPPFDTMPDPYAAEIAYADAQLGRLLEGVEARRERETLILFTADHGEGLGEHGEQTHGIVAYDGTLHVPLILAGPGVPAGERSGALARHVDIVPTVLDLLGLPSPEGLVGRSLLQAVAGNGAEPDGAVGYFESRGPHYNQGWAEIEGIRTDRWKYTAAPMPPELYDTIADPEEETNIVEKEPEVRQTMERLHAELRADAPRYGQSGPIQLAPMEMEQLAALGYVEAAGRYAPGEEPDPRRLAAVFSWVDQARNMAVLGLYDPAIEMLETLAESASVRPLVLRSLGPLYAEQGRYDEAIAAYRDYIELTGAQEAHVGLARVYLDAGRPSDALEMLAEVRPRSASLEVMRAYALSRLGRHAEAREAVDRAFARRPRSIERLRHRAALVIDVAPIEDGEEELRGLLARAPEDAMLRSQLGYYLATSGQDDQRDEALELLQSAAEAAPDDANVLANLGWGAYRLKEYAQAAEALEAALALEQQRPLESVRLAFVLSELGEVTRAIALLRTTLAAHPGAAWAEEARALLDDLRQRAGATHAPTVQEGDSRG